MAITISGGGGGTASISGETSGLVITNTDGALTIPTGNTDQRPASSTEGMIRFNTDNNELEQYNGSEWGSVGGASAVENKLINGAFAVAQRGTSFTSGSNNDDAYTLDRWYILSDGNDAVDVTQNTADTDTDDKYCIALDVETANKKFGIAQIIENENCYDLQGKTVTLSFKSKVSSTSKLDNVKCAIVSWSGTADSVTSDIISAWGVEGTNPTLIANATYENTPANLGVTTAWATYSASATIDTAGTNNVIVFIWSDVTDTTAGDFLYITNVQLEVGSSANTFQRRLYGEELALCQRYYYKIGEGGSAYTQFGVGRAFASTAGNGPVHFPVPMRSAPTFAFFGVVGDYDFSPTAIAGGAVPGNNMHMTVEMSFASIASGSIFIIGANAGAAGPAGFAFNSEL